MEMSPDELDRLWIVLHTGSPGIGNRIVTWHIAVYCSAAHGGQSLGSAQDP